ncbi:MAG TPA: ImmA/IrrE family metallo-endopeptidase [Candidatus Mediterraneibacter stercoravium]|uniref:ImmA/IrrE family metallo-endopeptidase n=1 Tax=Candidatus Mediterraneibacter stercoravium TaxID=2838685 RepID=A0A9D2G968_9FIRM|nr:ImmA/IrrE family metallo-endopeptidase [Candidatus Mediterraneibacter stercoravium]
MDYNKIVTATIEVFRKCDVHSFPIDCEDLLKYYGYRLFSYKELRDRSPELYSLSLGYSEDAFRAGGSKIVAYNPDRPHGRIRFSLMHELGHHVLEHTGVSDQNEKEANAFASHILAPRMAIHYSRCKNANDVARLFDMSFEAADNAFIDYRRWHRNVVMYKMSATDKAMYAHFYNKDQKCFVWSKQNCCFCGTVLYNSVESHCKICSLPPAPKEQYQYTGGYYDDNDRILQRQHLKWLYDF